MVDIPRHLPTEPRHCENPQKKEPRAPRNFSTDAMGAVASGATKERETAHPPPPPHPAPRQEPPDLVATPGGGAANPCARDPKDNRVLPRGGRDTVSARGGRAVPGGGAGRVGAGGGAGSCGWLLGRSGAAGQGWGAGHSPAAARRGR